MLYALRYQKQATSNIASLVASLKEQGVSAEDAQVIARFYLPLSSLTS